MTKDEKIKALEVENFELKNRLEIVKSEVETIKEVILSIELKLQGGEVFLKDIMPYLILKKTQAQLALYWLKNKPKIRRDGHGRVVKFTGNEIEFTNKIIILMKESKKIKG